MPDLERDANDEWTDRWLNDVADLGKALAKLHRTNPWPELPLLPQAMNYLMTELWDHGFSQSEIRQAFEDAIVGIPRYAGGVERRP